MVDIKLFLIANLAGFLSSTLCAISIVMPSKKKFIGVSLIDITFSIVANLILKGYSGVIVGIFALIRSLMVYNKVYSKIYAYTSVVLLVLVGLYFNNRGIVGIVPLVASTTYTLVLLSKNSSELKIKSSLAFNLVLWSTYNLYIQSYMASLLNFLTFIWVVRDIVKFKGVRWSLHFDDKNE